MHASAFNLAATVKTVTVKALKSVNNVFSNQFENHQSYWWLGLHQTSCREPFVFGGGLYFYIFKQVPSTFQLFMKMLKHLFCCEAPEFF